MTRRNLLVGCVMAMVPYKKLPASTPYLTQRRDGALSLTIVCFTRHWLDPFAREKSSWLLKIHDPSERERASGPNSRLNSLRMGITTEAGALFDNHPRLKNKALLLDITIINLCAVSNLRNAARHVGIPCRRSRAEEKQVSGLAPRYLLPPFSRYVDLW